jgi:hypothetical protein
MCALSSTPCFLYVQICSDAANTYGSSELFSGGGGDALPLCPESLQDVSAILLCSAGPRISTKYKSNSTLFIHFSVS